MQKLRRTSSGIVGVLSLVVIGALSACADDVVDAVQSAVVDAGGARGVVVESTASRNAGIDVGDGGESAGAAPTVAASSGTEANPGANVGRATDDKRTEPRRPSSARAGDKRKPVTRKDGTSKTVEKETARAPDVYVALTARDLSKKPLGDQSGALQKIVVGRVNELGRGKVAVSSSLSGRKGLAIDTHVKKVSVDASSTMTTVTVECGMTVSVVPNGGLRSSSSAKAAAALEGAASSTEKKELIGDALSACGKSLASDIVKQRAP